jgi:hypothetical protein
MAPSSAQGYLKASPEVEAIDAGGQVSREIRVQPVLVSPDCKRPYKVFSRSVNRLARLVWVTSLFGQTPDPDRSKQCPCTTIRRVTGRQIFLNEKQELKNKLLLPRSETVVLS